MSKSVSKSLPLLTEDQLLWVVEKLNLKPAAVRRLKAILVDGAPVAQATEREGLTPQAAYKLIHQVSNEMDRRLSETNKRMVTVIIGESDIASVRSFERLSHELERMDEPG